MTACDSPQTPAGLWLAAATGDELAEVEAATRREASARSWRIAEVYRPGLAGGDGGRDPELRRMLADVSRGRIGVLLTGRLDALAGNPGDLVDLEARLHGHGASLVSLAEKVDTSLASGRAFLRAAFAAGQLRRWEEVPLQTADRGRPATGPAPFGYRWRGATLTPHPFEAPVRTLVHELYADCGDPRQVARMLNERGFRLRSGQRFSEARILALLRDPVAIGLYRGNHYVRPARGTPARKEPAVQMRVEPLIPFETWQRCAEQLQARPAARRGAANRR